VIRNEWIRGGGREKSHKDLDVWRSAVDLAEDGYAISKTIPRDEQFGMTAQMRRASVSIASNIAEGAGRQTQREFAQFLYIALGSASELETRDSNRDCQAGWTCQCHDCERLDLLLARVAQMLRGLIRAVRSEDEN
jgi:four helix bundle protein